MPQKETLKCEKCGGEMKKKRESASTASSLLLLLIGIALLIFLPLIGWVIGPICIIIGLVKGSKFRFLWLCQDCGHNFERKATFKDYIK